MLGPDTPELEEARGTPPAVKLAQALELCAVGFRLERARLRERFPAASETEIEALFLHWLAGDDDLEA